MPTNAQSHGLRVIGQELEKRKVIDFEVFSTSDGYRVRGEMPPEPVDAPPPATGFFRKLFNRQADEAALQAQAAPPQPVAWEQEYSWSDIEQLDDEYRTQRRGVSGSPNDYATSQILRVVGAFVEHKHRTMAEVTRKGPFLKIGHEGHRGDRQTDAYKYADLYDFAQGQFRARQAEKS